MGLFSLIGGIISGNKQAKASKEAARLQYDATQQGIRENARQYDQTRADYQPFRDLGYDALGNFGDLLGLNGGDAQSAEIAALQASPLYQSLFSNGQDAILASASATGGLRGGNTQGALADFGRDTLSSVIQNQLANYGGAIGIGSGATDAVSSFGARAVQDQAALRNQGAAANAQSALVRGGIAGQNWSNIGSFADSIPQMFAGGGFNWGKLF
ncbi:hypothetical protein [Aurantiacibacter spongiae]|uniref:DNA transfer protein n=1 Tax=Aurantiacibacter spongiae TaxID=2488860 RepID=A0A3N5CND5_9SPHN|nr:hypothetical protein [Aurantiacibacter spongiae]RPF70444.1 hypothetical protein EG799_01475 [Aurantiacibacter spongiae]